MYNTIKEQPQVEPVSLQEVKTYLRVDNDQENALLEQLIKSARRMVEDYTSRALITQVHQVMGDLDGGVVLPMAPFQAIVGVPEVMVGKSSEKVHNYDLNVSRPQARVFFNHHFADNAVAHVQYRCGYGDMPDSVPDTLKQAICLLVADLYENRPGEGVRKSVPGFVRALLDPYRIVRIS